MNPACLTCAVLLFHRIGQMSCTGSPAPQASETRRKCQKHGLLKPEPR